MSIKKELSDCCGCTACASICNHNAITMEPDALGFLYPKVDISKCTDCGLCENVCAFNDNYDISQNLTEPQCYGARHKNMQEIETSRSGATFVAISDWILKQDGVVYGVGYTEHFRVVHKRATRKDERDEFKGSKYVQSDLGTVFRQVNTDLKEGHIVLFTGTPCQTAGLHSYISKKLRTNLYLVDIVCHRVPSPYMWRDYLIYLEKRMGSEISWVNFRDKQSYGWNSHKETFKFVNGEVRGKTSFTFLFYKSIMLRHSCGKCHFANTRHPSDITLADFWGWEKINQDINADNKGISLILINTEKGKQLFAAAKNDLNYIPAELQNCMQPNMQSPTETHPKRMQFEDDYIKKGFDYVYYKYGKDNWAYKIRHSFYWVYATIREYKNALINQLK